MSITRANLPAIAAALCCWRGIARAGRSDPNVLADLWALLTVGQSHGGPDLPPFTNPNIKGAVELAEAERQALQMIYVVMAGHRHIGASDLLLLLDQVLGVLSDDQPVVGAPIKYPETLQSYSDHLLQGKESRAAYNAAKRDNPGEEPPSYESFMKTVRRRKNGHG